MTKHTTPDHARLDRVVAEARQQRDVREAGYRERALKLFPWICGRCGREFAGVRLRELTVHHKDHNHDNNPADGSNWELLCLYCHDNEHSRVLDETVRNRKAGDMAAVATHNPFAGLQALLKKKNRLTHCCAIQRGVTGYYKRSSTIFCPTLSRRVPTFESWYPQKPDLLRPYL